MRLDAPDSWLDDLEDADFSEDDEEFYPVSHRAEELRIPWEDAVRDALRLGVASLCFPSAPSHTTPSFRQMIEQTDDHAASAGKCGGEGRSERLHRNDSRW